MKYVVSGTYILTFIIGVMLLCGIVSCAADQQQTTVFADNNTIGNTQNEITVPDLIIESVSYMRRASGHGGVASEGLDLTYTVRVKNIGTAVAENHLLYIDLTRSAEAFTEGYYETGGLLGSDIVIEPGEVREFTFIGTVYYDETDKVRFIINPSSGKGDFLLPYIEEADYSNNTFELTITEPIPSPPVQPKPEPDIIKYTSNSTQYFVTGETQGFPEEELMEFFDILLEHEVVTEEAVPVCMDIFEEYIYAFPGYSYDQFSLGDLSVEEIDENTLKIRIEGRYGKLADTASLSRYSEMYGEWYSDCYEIRLLYNRETGEYEHDETQIDRRLIPEEVYNNALKLAGEHPVFQQFEASYGVETSTFVRWFDSATCVYALNPDTIMEMDFSVPFSGVIELRLESPDYHDLPVFVNVFTGEVITIGPSYNPPQ